MESTDGFSWFLEKASERNDILGLTKWLTAIHNANESIGPFSESLDALLGGIEYHGRALTEHQLLDFDETEQVAVADLAGVDLVDLALVDIR